MREPIFESKDNDELKPAEKKSGKNYFRHIGLFLITFVTATFAGMEWTIGFADTFEISWLAKGLPYSISILFILSIHEFGHYFAAKYHGVNATLPYYIPFPPIPGFLNFGTMGAVIRTKSKIDNNKIMFDIGAAGPIAGFIACLIVLIYGFTNLPEFQYILDIHPDYLSESYGKGALGLEFGDTLLFAFLRSVLTDTSQFVPPMSEIYHYPYLCAGWFGLFITAMNMVPVGQLDGGHVLYSMLGGKKHEAVASISMIALFILGMIGLISFVFDLNLSFGWIGWLFWALIIYFFIKVKHPPVYNFQQLSNRRLFAGYFSFFILLVSFSPTPFIVNL